MSSNVKPKERLLNSNLSASSTLPCLMKAVTYRCKERAVTEEGREKHVEGDGKNCEAEDASNSLSDDYVKNIIVAITECKIRWATRCLPCRQLVDVEYYRVVTAGKKMTTWPIFKDGNNRKKGYLISSSIVG